MQTSEKSCWIQVLQKHHQLLYLDKFCVYTDLCVSICDVCKTTSIVLILSVDVFLWTVNNYLCIDQLSGAGAPSLLPAVHLVGKFNK